MAYETEQSTPDYRTKRAYANRARVKRLRAKAMGALLLQERALMTLTRSQAEIVIAALWAEWRRLEGRRVEVRTKRNEWSLDYAAKQANEAGRELRNAVSWFDYPDSSLQRESRREVVRWGRRLEAVNDRMRRMLKVRGVIVCQDSPYS
jgi:hypothetical protein